MRDCCGQHMGYLHNPERASSFGADGWKHVKAAVCILIDLFVETKFKGLIVKLQKKNNNF